MPEHPHWHYMVYILPMSGNTLPYMERMAGVGTWGCSRGRLFGRTALLLLYHVVKVDKKGKMNKACIRVEMMESIVSMKYGMNDCFEG